MNRFGLSILPCAFAIIALQCTQPNQLSNNSGGSEVVGKLVYASDKPVNKAIVRAYRILPGDSLPQLDVSKMAPPTDTAVSNDKGEYAFYNLDTGLYNFFGTGLNGTDTVRSFHDNIHNIIAPNSHPPHPLDVGTDTMHAPGKIRGRVILETGDSTPITCYIPGSSFSSISDDTGAFTISSVPPGVYRLYYMDFYSHRYQSAKDSGVVVKQDSVTVLAPKVLTLSTAGPPPAPKGVTMSYDTVSGQVALSWNKVNVADLKDYIVSRTDSIVDSFLPISTVQKSDTSLIDAVYMNSSDTSGHTYFYELFSQDSGGDKSNHSNIISVDVVPPSVLRTSFFLSSTNTHSDTAAIGDKISIIANYENKTTIVKTIFWSLEKPDSLVRSSNVTQLNGWDTLTMSWNQPGTKTIYVRSLDSANRTWTDSIKIYIVQDMPIVKYLSPDTTIDYGGTVQCSIAVVHRFGLCTLHIDLNHDSLYEITRVRLTFDTLFNTGMDTLGGKVRIRITDAHGNKIDTSFLVTIRHKPHNVWVSGDTLSVARRSISTAVLNGTLYAIGGCWDKYSSSGAYIPQAYSRVEAYDTVLNRWTLIDSLRNARYECVSAVVNDKIYVIGGRGNRGAYVNTIEEYDPAGSKTWTIYDTMLIARAGNACCMLGNTLYIFGGITGNFVAMDSIYSYDVSAKKWSGVGKMQQPRYDFQVVAVNGNAYLLGGYSHNDTATEEATLGSVEIFNPSSGQTSPMVGDAMGARSNFAASTVNGSIYVFGGLGPSSPTQPISPGLTSVSKFDLQQWTPLLDLQQARYYFSAECINGRIYCVGGATGPWNSYSLDNKTLIYYP